MFTGKSAAESNRFETEHFSTIGALILGRRMADLGIGPWGEEPTFHAPCFVVTHRPADTIVKKGGISYIFVTDGPEAAWPKLRTPPAHRTCSSTAAPTSPASTSTRG
jgi:dihydrofolate reductase